MPDNRANDPAFTDEAPNNQEGRTSSVPHPVPRDMVLNENARMPLSYKPLLKRYGNCSDAETTVSDPQGQTERDGNKFYARYDPQGSMASEMEIFGRDSRDLTEWPNGEIRQQLDRFRQRQISKGD